jgi:ABC-2 type transport system permease protein
VSTPQTLDPPAAAGPLPARKAPVLKTVMQCEWRLVRTDLGWWTAIVLLLACVGYAVSNGRARLDERSQGIHEAQKDETARLSSLTKLLGRIERHEVPPPDAPYRDPRNAIYVGRGQAAAVAYLPDRPLALAAVGLSDLYPPAFKVSAGSKDSFLFVDEIANPSHLLSGSFDLAFVLVYLYPLLLLALSYNILSGEQEQGTLALTAASSARLTTVLAGKLAVRAGGVIAAAVLGSAALLFRMGFRIEGANSLLALGLLSLAIAIYGLFWVALALVVNSLRRDSAFNAVALVMAWVLLVLVAPAAMNAAAQALYPAPARAEMVLAVRTAAIDAERDRAATEARYREEHRNPGDSPRTGSGAITDERSKLTLAVTVAADSRADAVLASQEDRIREQRRLSDRLSLLAPPALVNDAIAELAGNGHTRWDDYLSRIGEFHGRWRSFFVDRAARGQALSSADYPDFPRFEPSDSGSGWFASSTLRVLLSLAWVGAVAIALLAWADRRLSRAA